MRFRLFSGVAALGLLGLGAVGCGPSDPIESSTKEFTVAPEATLDPEAMQKAQEEMQRKQEAADKAAGRR